MKEKKQEKKKWTRDQWLLTIAIIAASLAFVVGIATVIYALSKDGCAENTEKPGQHESLEDDEGIWTPNY